MEVMVIVMVTVMVGNVAILIYSFSECHRSLKSGEKWDQAVELLISLLTSGPGHFLW